MKISSILAGILVLILTTGCSQVVYSIKPDSPPKMSIADAKDAYELSLSLAIRPPGTSMTLRGDELILVQTYQRGITSKAGYDDISREVGKQGKDFYVNFFAHNQFIASSKDENIKAHTTMNITMHVVRIEP